jgi:hypothetical protein
LFLASKELTISTLKKPVPCTDSPRTRQQQDHLSKCITINVHPFFLCFLKDYVAFFTYLQVLLLDCM